MTNAFASWLCAPPLALLLAALDKNGEEARVVGGAVRNALLGEPVSEWDIATTATPEEVGERCRALGWKVVPTGVEHGTVTVVVSGKPFEVTTLREDIETDGRRAVVRFGRDFRADALRRDFTINALSLSRDGTVHDYVGGLDDLAARRVRFIGDADRRLAEDYLRILRLFRFHARYGEGRLDAASFAAAIRARHGLAFLSRERVSAEMKKLVMARRAPQVLAEIDGAGFLLCVLGGVARLATFTRLAALEAELGLVPESVRRLAALALFVREDGERLVERLRLSNAEARRLLSAAVAGETLATPLDERGARALVYCLGREVAADAVLLAWARSGDPAWQMAFDLGRHWSAPRCPFNGADAARLGLAPGPRLGRVLAEAERRWIAADFPDAPAAREDILRQALEAAD
jgi:tRNA nucleotidyltransferase/poly(A) polymerase